VSLWHIPPHKALSVFGELRKMPCHSSPGNEAQTEGTSLLCAICAGHINITIIQCMGN
jgi:hypothetical protein